MPTHSKLHILILYLVTLLNYFINASYFSVCSFGLSMLTIISPAKMTIVFCFLSFLFSSSCFAVQAEIFYTLLTRNGNSGHPCLDFDFKGNLFNSSLLSIMFYFLFKNKSLRLFEDAFYQVTEVPLYSYFAKSGFFSLSLFFLNQEWILNCCCVFMRL